MPRDLDRELERLVAAIHLHEHVSLVEAVVAARPRNDARGEELLQELGVDLGGLGEPTDRARDGAFRGVQTLDETDDAPLEAVGIRGAPPTARVRGSDCRRATRSDAPAAR